MASLLYPESLKAVMRGNSLIDPFGYAEDLYRRFSKNPNALTALEATGLPTTLAGNVAGNMAMQAGAPPSIATGVDVLTQTGILPAAIAKGVPKLGKEIAKQYESGQGLIGSMSVNPRQNVIPVDVAAKFDMPVTLPQSDDFISAVKGTKGAEITPEGVKLNVVRYQKPEQELEESVRTAVFYLPEGNPNVKHYKNKGTLQAGNPYGGSEQIKGETLYKNPLFVKGATGGKVPEEAYKNLFGNDELKKLTEDARFAAGAPYHMKEEVAYSFLEKYAPDIADNAWYIVQNSKKGNQLRYALQEAAISNAARQKGYDSILGFSKGRGDKGNFFSEVIDLREGYYPSASGEFDLRPEFQGLLK